VLLFFLMIADPSRYFFLNDDFIHIPLAANANFFHGSFVRPLSNLSLWFDNKIWGQNAYGYHLTNVLIHLANTVLVFFLGKRVFSLSSNEQSSVVKAAASSLLFLIYYCHSEPIFWIIGRGGSLATVFFLIALLFHLKSWSGCVAYYILSLLFFAAGLLTYEVMWCYPLVIAIFSVLFRRKQEEGAKLFGVFIFFVLFLFLRVKITGHVFSDYEIGSFNSGFRIVRLIYNFNALIGRCFLPPMKNGASFVVSYAAFIFGMLIAVIKAQKALPLVLMLFCVAVCVLPVVSLGIDTHDSESERYIYLATVFAVFLLVELIFKLPESGFRIALPVLLIFHGYQIVNAADAYKFSSMVTKRSLECIPILSTESMVITSNVPTQYQGALIFRIGLPEALEWFKGIRKSDVRVMNEKEVFQKFPDLACAGLASNNVFSDLVGLESTKPILPTKNIALLTWQHDSIFFKRE
jgi:hypothetical protein